MSEQNQGAISPETRLPRCRVQVLETCLNACLVLDLREYSVLNSNNGSRWAVLICWLGYQWCTVIQHIMTVFRCGLYLLLFLGHSCDFDTYFSFTSVFICRTFPLSGKMTFCCFDFWGIFGWWLIYSKLPTFLQMTYLRNKSHFYSTDLFSSKT